MKKIEIIDLLKHRLANGDCPQELKGKYHPEIIGKHCVLALNYLIKEIAYKEAQRDNNFSMLDVYAKTFKNVEILKDTDRDEYYSLLPANVIPLPKNRGVRLISPMKNQKYSFVYRDNNTANIHGNLDVEDVLTRPRYYVEGDKIFYSKHLISDINKVLIKLIVDFDGLDDEDDVPIPSGYGKLIFDLVFQSMQGMGMEKVSNDNNANVP